LTTQREISSRKYNFEMHSAGIDLLLLISSSQTTKNIV